MLIDVKIFLRAISSEEMFKDKFSSHPTLSRLIERLSVTNVSNEG